MTNLATLVERCKAATGADRGIDAAIAAEMGIGVHHIQGRWPMPEAYTSDLNAIIGLIEAKLPGWVFTICSCQYDGTTRGSPWADLASSHWIEGLADADGQYAEATAATTALALCIAFLAAISKDGVLR